MARPLRIEYPGALYHVTSRGNARATVFDSDADRFLFLSVLSKTVKRFNWLCHAYCLMDNHYHLMIETPDGNLSAGRKNRDRSIFTSTGRQYVSVVSSGASKRGAKRSQNKVNLVSHY